MMYRSKFQYVPLIALGLLLFIGSASANAGVLEDIPDGVADALGTSTTTAELILSCMILLSVGMVLAMSRKQNMILTITILLGFVGMLTAIQWLDPWLLIMVGLIIALMFGGGLRDWAQSRAGGG